MTTETTNYSRPLLLAASSSGTDTIDLNARLTHTTVLITADLEAPSAVTTLRVLVANLRRLPIHLHLDPEGGGEQLPADLVEHLAHLAIGIDPVRPLDISRPELAAVHVHVGTNSATANVSGVADGHGTRIRPQGHPYPALFAPGTGLGGVITAAMLTAEIFKIVVDVLPNRRGPLVPIDFCPVTLTEPNGTVPDLAPLDGTALIGCGAIGTAIALILRELNAVGDLTVVDPETYDEPNVTTYSLGNVQTALKETRKVDLIRDELLGVSVDRFIGTARDFLEAIDAGAKKLPTVVLGAVDSIDARHEIAALHADQTIDGSTGGPTGTMLSLSEATWEGPCLRCYYPPRSTRRPSVTDLLSERTGLTHERLARGTEELTADEIDGLVGLTAEDRAILERQVGKGVCGLGRAFGLVGEDNDFNPSAAFVAQQAAALVVGALIRGVGARPKYVQYDALFGTHQDMTLQLNPRAGCRCQTDRELHRVVRSHRRPLFEAG